MKLSRSAQIDWQKFIFSSNHLFLYGTAINHYLHKEAATEGVL